MHNKLLDIIEKKKQDLIVQKRKLPEEKLKKEALEKHDETEFTAFIMHPKRKDIALIAEIKLASPTISSLGDSKEVVKRAIVYEDAQADTISFITEKHYFKGDVSFIPRIKNAVKIPVLQKDFVIDTYQIYEAKKMGSDALLLIARIISLEELKEFVGLCQELEIEPIVEIQSEEDLKKAEAAFPSVIAVNARDLETFTIDIPKACDLLKKVPDSFIKLGFSGIQSAKEVEQYREAGAVGVLIGTSLMKTEKVEDFLNEL